MDSNRIPTRKKLGSLVAIIEDDSGAVLDDSGLPRTQFAAHEQGKPLSYYSSSFGDAPWIHMDCAYGAVDRADRAEKRELFWKLEQALVPSQHISDAAEAIKELLRARSKAAGADGGYTALHLRVEPDWVEHCKLWDATQPEAERNCMTNSLILDRVFLIERVPEKRPVFVAAELTRDLVDLAEVMERMQLGPNGGTLFCLEYLEKNIDWLLERLEAVRFVG